MGGGYSDRLQHSFFAPCSPKETLRGIGLSADSSRLNDTLPYLGQFAKCEAQLSLVQTGNEVEVLGVI